MQPVNFWEDILPHRTEGLNIRICEEECDWHTRITPATPQKEAGKGRQNAHEETPWIRGWFRHTLWSTYRACLLRSTLHCFCSSAELRRTDVHIRHSAKLAAMAVRYIIDAIIWTGRKIHIVNLLKWRLIGQKHAPDHRRSGKSLQGQ